MEPFPFPSHLLAPGITPGATAFVAVLPASELPAGAMRRVSRGDLDVLLAHTPSGIVAVDDRCPHMAAPLSIPLVNLAVPVLGVATFTHIFHRLAADGR